MTVSSVNVGVAKKLIIRAAHPSTSDVEAIGALRKLHELLDKGSSSIEAVLDVKATSGPAPAPAEFINKIVDLEKALAERDTAIGERDITIGMLNSQISTLREAFAVRSEDKSSDTTDPIVVPASPTSYQTFYLACIKKFGHKVHGWQTIFCENTGISRSTLQQWRIRGEVPAKAFDQLNGVEAVESRTRKQAWTSDEMNRLAELVAPGNKSDAALAETLTAEFGRKITPNSIAGSKSRLRSQGKI